MDATQGAEMRTVGCFIRVDVGVSGEHSTDVYDELSERLQNLLQEAIIERADGGPELELQSMTCPALGPLRADHRRRLQRRRRDHAETLWREDHFRPVAEWLASSGDRA
ncbi:MAG: hypothetical protein ABI807_03845 [Sporichthyaceae bacterium]